MSADKETVNDPLQTIQELGSLGYSCSRCMNVLNIPNDERTAWELQFINPESDIAKAYKKGRDQADFAIDIALFNKAKEGDIDALNRYEERMEERRQRGE